MTHSTTFEIIGNWTIDGDNGQSSESTVVCLNKWLTKLNDNFKRKSMKNRYLPGPINAEFKTLITNHDIDFYDLCTFLMCYFWLFLFFPFFFFPFSFFWLLFGKGFTVMTSRKVWQFCCQRIDFGNCHCQRSPCRLAAKDLGPRSLTREVPTIEPSHREVDVLCGAKLVRCTDDAQHHVWDNWQLNDRRCGDVNGQR